MQASEPRIVYRPREDVTQVAELDALVSIYGYLLNHSEHKKATQSARQSGHDNSERLVDE